MILDFFICPTSGGHYKAIDDELNKLNEIVRKVLGR
jgi:hypothetical protein